jgi:acetyl-CoA synthetase
VYDEAVFREFLGARDQLLRHADDYPAAYASFQWPHPETFNWATDWFDQVARRRADTVALRVIRADGERQATFGELADRSLQVAAWLTGQGIARGDVVALILENRLEYWELQLALIRMGAVLVPLFTSLAPEQIAERIRRSGAQHLICEAPADVTVPGIRVTMGEPAGDWVPYAESRWTEDRYVGDERTPADSKLFYFFTSGTTSRPKLVTHSHVSYAIGHLSSMYLHGLRPGDVHLNLATPGWAKHPWSSFFAPWNAEATIVSMDSAAATPKGVLNALEERRATSFCAPPSLWRALLREGIGDRDIRLRTALSVGEPLSESIVREVEGQWGVVVRNGYGQSEVTAIAGVLDGVTDDPTSLGRPLPGYRLRLCADGDDTARPEGEICVEIDGGHTAMMIGYLDETGPLSEVGRGSLYRTGDLGRWEPGGGLRFLGRRKDAFIDPYGRRVIPVEVERHLSRHTAVAELAVVPVQQDGGVVAKAYVSVGPGWNTSAATATAIIDGTRDGLTGLAALEFVDDFPRTESGKIHREVLRGYPRSAALEFPVSGT